MVVFHFGKPNAEQKYFCCIWKPPIKNYSTPTFDNNCVTLENVGEINGKSDWEAPNKKLCKQPTGLWTLKSEGLEIAAVEENGFFWWSAVLFGWTFFHFWCCWDFRGERVYWTKTEVWRKLEATSNAWMPWEISMSVGWLCPKRKVGKCPTIPTPAKHLQFCLILVVWTWKMPNHNWHRAKRWCIAHIHSCYFPSGQNAASVDQLSEVRWRSIVHLAWQRIATALTGSKDWLFQGTRRTIQMRKNLCTLSIDSTHRSTQNSNSLLMDQIPENSRQIPN